MPRKSRLKLPPLKLGNQTVGERITRLRKEMGHTQVELARKIGITQNLISAYELNTLRLSSDMVVRFAKALEVTADELLGLKSSRNGINNKSNLKIIQRLKKIESLSTSERKALFKTIDMFLKAAEK